MVDYTAPTEYPYEDLPSTDTPVYAAAMNGIVESLVDLGGATGRVTTLEDTRLSTWQAALDRARVSGGVATWLAIGDSISEGQGASTKANRWMDIVLGAVRTSVGATGGVGYIPTQYSVTAPDSTWANMFYSSFTQNGDYEAQNAGFGYRSRFLDSDHGGRGWTVTGTSVDLWWYSSTDTGVFSYQVDAGTQIPVCATGPRKVHKLRIALGGSGSHTVKARQVSGGGVEILGMTVYDGDETVGVRFVDATRTGVTSALYTGDDGTDTVDWLRTAAGLRDTTPDLVTIMLGVNDYNGDTATAQQTRFNLQYIVNELRATGNDPSILVILPYPLGVFDDPAVGQTETWNDYREEIIIFASDNNAALLDLAVTMPIPGGVGVTAYQSDGHPNNAGQALIATLVGNVLLTQPTADVPTRAPVNTRPDRDEHEYRVDTVGVTTPEGISGAYVTLVAAGGGGGSGRRGTAGTVRCGGGGGGPGGHLREFFIPAVAFGADYTFGVGTGGAGGAAVTTNDTNGNAGSAGGDTYLSTGTLVMAAGGGGGGAGGTNAGGAGGYAGSAEFTLGLTGGADADAAGGVGGSAAESYSHFIGAGGAGGGVTSGNSASNGGAGQPGTRFGLNTAAAGGVAGGAAAVAGTSSLFWRGTGAGGGAGSAAGAGGAGAAGGSFGGAGGGGGASVNGQSSGAGGAGAPGVARIVFVYD